MKKEDLQDACDYLKACGYIVSLFIDQRDDSKPKAWLIRIEEGDPEHDD